MAYGTLKSDPSALFFLTLFRPLSEEVVDPRRLAEILGTLHQTSVSPNGKFGFHVTTFNGVVPLVNH